MALHFIFKMQTFNFTQKNYSELFHKILYKESMVTSGTSGMIDYVAYLLVITYILVRSRKDQVLDHNPPEYPTTCPIWLDTWITSYQGLEYILI